MEYLGGWPDQTRACRRPDPSLTQTLRAQWLPALRAWQMVSGREPSALGLRAVLAQRRRVDLVRSWLDREGNGPARCDDRTGRELHRRHRPASWYRQGIHAAGL